MWTQVYVTNYEWLTFPQLRKKNAQVMENILSFVNISHIYICWLYIQKLLIFCGKQDVKSDSPGFLNI